MIDMLKFVEESKTKDLVKLNSDIKVNTMHVWLEYKCNVMSSQLGQTVDLEH